MAEAITTPNDLKIGQTVSIHQKIKDVNSKGEEKERIQIFTGMLIARKGKASMDATITIRKVSNGVSVTKVFPVALPDIEKIVVEKTFKTKKSKMYYLDNYKKRLKEV